MEVAVEKTQVKLWGNLKIRLGSKKAGKEIKNELKKSSTANIKQRIK